MTEGSTVEIPVGPLALAGELDVPAGAAAVVAFAHGSGSSRLSPRNRAVAGRLRERGLGTLLLDLLTTAEERDRANVFDIRLLAGRLASTTAWLRTMSPARGLRVGAFGASTGAAAALSAAADPAAGIEAVVSRGGRPDLAAADLPRVTAPTLLIVGGADTVVLELNRRAAALLTCEHGLVVVPGASHLFEEPGALEEVAELAADWLAGHLAADGGA